MSQIKLNNFFLMFTISVQSLRLLAQASKSLATPLSTIASFPITVCSSFMIIFVLIRVFVIRTAEIASLNKIHGKLLLGKQNVFEVSQQRPSKYFSLR